MRGSHHFVIGASHEVCEDYAYSTDDFAALSDGCSVVKGPDGKRREAHTDVGSRLLVRAAFHHREEGRPDLLARLAIHTADGYQRSMDLGADTLSATLACLRIRDGEMFGQIIGDGVLAVRREGEWSVWAWTFDPIPYYPRYILSSSQPETVVSVTEVVIGDIVPFTETTPFPMGMMWGPGCELMVAISDGAFSFTKDSKSVPFDSELALRLLDFRRMGGKFMVRHLRGVLKELAEDGIVNQDDISMVALYRG